MRKIRTECTTELLLSRNCSAKSPLAPLVAVVDASLAVIVAVESVYTPRRYRMNLKHSSG